MAELLFPKRQRCKTCGKGLGQNQAPVLFGLYCSPRCAGIAQPATNPEHAPRECTTMRDDLKVFKRRYRSEGEVPDKIREDPSSSFYWCGHCGFGHSGHTRMGEAEKFRMLGSPEELADFLIKRRGKATHAQVAKAAGVQPIRLKELENPKKGQRVDVHVLFAVMNVLRARPGVAMQELRAGGGR